MNVFDLYASITLDHSDYERELGEASKKTNSFANKMKSGLATAGKVATAGLTAVSAAAVAVGKSALDSYGEYEQLAGGVETLFKESASVVQEYANNAYKNAGMSANEYMSTVTSFSASLLQSLGGDTAEAAKYADRAIVSMADNANKMGTSIEMIQNAYQGFAKQNYTMLDNLKLGYGGTKQEMERLISDAAAMTDVQRELGITVDESSMSFANIVNAIEVMQSSLGIAGATAAEASSTIEGSLSAAKSAWANLVVGIADENANLGDLVTKFFDSVGVAADNILPRIGIIVKRIGEVVVEALPDKLQAAVTEAITIVTGFIENLDLEKWGNVFLDAFSKGYDAIKKVIEITAELIPTIQLATGTFISFKAAMALQSAVQWFQQAQVAISLLSLELGKANLAQAALNGTMTVGETIVALLTGKMTLAALAQEAMTKAQIALNAVLTANPIGIVVTAIGALVAAFIVLYNHNDKFRAAVESAWSNIQATIGDAVEKISAFFTETIPDAAKSVLGWLQSIPDQMKEVGKNLLMGLWNGIADKISWLKGKVTGVVDTIKSWFTGPSGFDEHSPSKWSKGVFQYVMEGGAQGLEAGLPSLMSNVKSVTETVKNGMEMEPTSVEFSTSAPGGFGGRASGRTEEVLIPITTEIDGAVLARKLYKLILREGDLRGGTLVEVT